MIGCNSDIIKRPKIILILLSSKFPSMQSNEYKVVSVGFPMQSLKYDKPSG